MFFSIPSVADASIISFFSSIFSTADAKEEMLLADANSQNMSLLQAVQNSDPNAAKGGGDIIIVGD